jgi:RimJ/RimL family protein N-acetyltransferase
MSNINQETQVTPPPPAPPTPTISEPPVVNITGDLIALGPIRRDLLPTYERWINDFAAVRNLGVPPRPISTETETAWFDGVIANPTDASFTIYERSTWRAIGTTALHGIDHRHRTGEFGILIGETDARGRGFGTEAARLMLDYSFTALGLHNVMLRVHAYNLAGLRAYQKAGFREFGRRREAILMSGRLWDVVYMECLASEFTSPVLGAMFAAAEPRSPTR